MKDQDKSSDSSSSSWTDINRLLFSKSEDKSKSEASSKESEQKPMDPSAASIVSSIAIGHPIEALKSFKALTESESWNGVSLRDPDAADDSSDTAVIHRSDEGENDSENPAMSSFHPQHQDNDTLVQEIASWISDRLPSGNLERRAIAQERDKLIEQETGLTLYAPQNPVKTSTDLPGFTGVTSSSIGAAALAAGSGQSREAASSSKVSHSAAFSTQQASLAKAADDAAATNQNVGMEKDREEESRRQPKSLKPVKEKEFSDLERFWIALCRHLHNEGH